MHRSKPAGVLAALNCCGIRFLASQISSSHGGIPWQQTNQRPKRIKFWKEKQTIVGSKFLFVTIAKRFSVFFFSVSQNLFLIIAKTGENRDFFFSSSVYFRFTFLSSQRAKPADFFFHFLGVFKSSFG
jgi:hypothetical protein